MAEMSCPLPTRQPDSDLEALVRRLTQARRIAVVGATDQDRRAGAYVPQYLIAAGREVIPVNPKYTELWGRRCYASLAEVPGPIELVNVFRKAEVCPGVVREAIAAGAKAVWLQSGIVSAEARKLAQAAGLDYVEDRCLMVEVRRLAR
jgi:predicted CoA-binding protein